MKNVTAIKTYFEQDPHGRKVTIEELKALKPAEREELGKLACIELGVEHESA
jgi:hypothetical protein